MASAAALVLAASAASEPRRRHPTPATPEFNAAVGKVFNPSDQEGRHLKMAISEDWDSVDTGDTYYGSSWNLLRLYSRRSSCSSRSRAPRVTS